MEIFISASTDAIKKNKKRYLFLESLLKRYGYTNSNTYLSHMTKPASKKREDVKNIHRSILKNIKKSSLVIVDISYPSLTLGSQIEYAIMNNIAVLCICDEKAFDDGPTLLKYYDQKLLSFATFTEDTLEDIISRYLKNFKKQKIKFNVFISPEINRYLNWYAKKYQMSKSDVFRRIIQNQMQKDKDYH